MATKKKLAKKTTAAAKKNSRAKNTKKPARAKSTRATRSAGSARARALVSPLVRVTGIGGFFFRSADPKQLMEWYRKHLGIQAGAFGGWAFQWREKRRSQRIGYTVFSPFEKNTTYFDPSEKAFMFNFRVANLKALLALLRREGVHVVDDVQDLPYGKFGWIIDPEGNKIELWEPPDNDDPFGEGQA